MFRVLVKSRFTRMISTLKYKCPPPRNEGTFTCTSDHSNSVIDYIIMSSCLVPYVKDFRIDAFDPCLSDKHTVANVGPSGDGALFVRLIKSL